MGMRILPRSYWGRGVLLVGLMLFAWAVYIEIFWIPANRKMARHKSVASQEMLVNEFLTKQADVTGDGVVDRISLKIVGAGWDQPFKWTLSIVSGDKLVYEQSADDAWLDRFFHDKGYVNDKCPDYLACKKQYYLDDFLKSIVYRVDLKEARSDESYWRNVRVSAEESLREKYGLSPAEAEKTIDWMAGRIKSGGAVMLNVPKSPVQGECAQMYVPSVGGFVTVYCD